MERDQAFREHDPSRLRRLFHLRLQPARSRGGTRRLLRAARADELVARSALRRRDPALWARRRGACLVASLHSAAALLRLLPGVGVAGLAEADFARAAADPCVRGHALDTLAPRVRCERAVVGAWAQCCLSLRWLSCLPLVPASARVNGTLLQLGE